MLYKQKHFSDKKWKQIFDKEFQLHRATVKKKIYKVMQGSYFYTPAEETGVWKTFFCIILYPERPKHG